MAEWRDSDDYDLSTKPSVKGKAPLTKADLELEVGLLRAKLESEQTWLDTDMSYPALNLRTLGLVAMSIVITIFVPYLLWILLSEYVLPIKTEVQQTRIEIEMLRREIEENFLLEQTIAELCEQARGETGNFSARQMCVTLGYHN